jgi:NADPH:quinone reductase-like Zn-dependent oxidoreductase
MSMPALVQTQDGYASELPDSTTFESLDPYLAATMATTPAPGRGEVLIRVRMAPVNPSDITFIVGAYGQPRVAGAPAGFEGVGEVVRSGGGLIADRLVDKRVSFYAGVSGSWAGYAVAAARTCIPLRDDVSDENGAALLINPMSAWAMYDLVRREGAKAFVMTAASSQLCKLVTTLASEKGYRPISLVRRDEQIEPLRRLGAAHVLNTEAPGFNESLAGVLKVEKPRILLDALSGPLPQSVFAAMGKDSRWVVYGGLDLRPASLPDPGQLIFQSKRIEGFWLTSWLQNGSPIRMLKAARGVQSRFASGAWNTDVAERVPLSEALARIPALLAGANRGKVLLTP